MTYNGLAPDEYGRLVARVEAAEHELFEILQLSRSAYGTATGDRLLRVIHRLENWRVGALDDAQHQARRA